MLNTEPDSSVRYPLPFDPQLNNVVHVVAAVIKRTTDDGPQIFLAKRPDKAHQGGLWEFPGGKVEPGESIANALSRELYEELGISIHLKSKTLRPLIQILHEYSDKKVFLDVWELSQFDGNPFGKEGQQVKWVNVSELKQYSFPEANVPIVKACSLPRSIAITPGYNTLSDVQDDIPMYAALGVELLVFRQPQEETHLYREWLAFCRDEASQHGINVLASGDMGRYDEALGGIHMPFCHAKELKVRPVEGDKWFGVSCHSIAEIEHAESIGADFVTLSPVMPTRSHPEAEPLGWSKFSEIVSRATVPVYALGGLGPEQLDEASCHGAQGIAGIRCWHSKGV